MTTSPTFETVNPDGGTPCLLICDHASNSVPAHLRELGLDERYLDRHIAWDIGAAEVTRLLAEKIDAPAVLAGFSRLVIDPNRRLDEAGLIPDISDGIPIPGNQGLSETGRAARIEDYYWPYHNAISKAISRFRANGEIPIVFSVHSYTPFMDGTPRIWDAGVLWNQDQRAARPLIDFLEDHEDMFIIGDNQPYSGKVVANTLDYHGSATGLPHAAIEIRQDLLSEDGDTEYWAGILLGALRHLLSLDGLRKIDLHRPQALAGAGMDD